MKFKSETILTALIFSSAIQKDIIVTPIHQLDMNVSITCSSCIKANNPMTSMQTALTKYPISTNNQGMRASRGGFNMSI